MGKIRVRFAPSPTGYLHIGGLRTALYDYIFAKQRDGDYILRIEDTDRTRLVDDATKSLVDVLNRLGVKHDEGPQYDSDGVLYQVGDHGPYIQSKNLDEYKAAADKLVKDGHAYPCFCSKERLDMVREEKRKAGQTPRYDGFCRNISPEEAQKRIEKGEPYVIRLKLPENTDISFKDHIRGDVTFNTEDLDDQVLIKQDGFPTYHLAVVVDDHNMEISHVIRGEEWVSSTPKHVALYESLGWEEPEYIHLPLILNEQKRKLSKRHDDVSVDGFLEDGYLEEAIINYVSMLGWSPGEEDEIMGMDELIERFDFSRLSHSSAVFSVDKMRWVNAQHIRRLDPDDLAERAIPYLLDSGLITQDDVKTRNPWVKRIVSSLSERVEVLKDFGEKAKVFFGEEIVMENSEAEDQLKTESAREVIEALIAEVETLEKIDEEAPKAPFKAVQKKTGHKGKALFMTSRVALSGQTHGVDIGDLMIILGKDLILKRLRGALKYCD